MQDYELLVKQISTNKLELLRIIIGKELNERIVEASNIVISEDEGFIKIALPKHVDIIPIFSEYGPCDIKYLQLKDGLIVYVSYNDSQHHYNALTEKPIIKEAIKALVLSC